MKLAGLKSSGVAILSASVASLCCLLPLIVIVLGLGSGAFMAVTMQYTSVFLPVGILGTAAGYVLYFRERRRCDRLGCAMAGSRINLVLLLVSTVVLAAAVTLTALPDYTARLIASWGGMAAMEPGAMASPAPVAHPATAGPVSGPQGPAMAAATVTLQVEGMTWGSWPLVVQRALAGLPGVRQADVSLAEGEARVEYDAHAVTVDQMVRAITAAGFSARPRPQWPAARARGTGPGWRALQPGTPEERPMPLEIKTAEALVDAELEARWNARRAERRDAVFQHVLRTFVARPGPVPVDGIVAAFPDHLDDGVRGTLARLDAEDLLLLQDGHVQLAYPFSGIPTPFTVVLSDGQARYACCAIDALGIPAMLGERVLVRSHCHHCHEPLEFAAGPAGPDPTADGVMVWVGRRCEGERRIATAL